MEGVGGSSGKMTKPVLFCTNQQSTGEGGEEAMHRVDSKELHKKGEELHIWARNAHAEAENVLAWLLRV